MAEADEERRSYLPFTFRKGAGVRFICGEQILEVVVREVIGFCPDRAAQISFNGHGGRTVKYVRDGRVELYPGIFVRTLPQEENKGREVKLHFDFPEKYKIETFRGLKDSHQR